MQFAQKQMKHFKHLLSSKVYRQSGMSVKFHPVVQIKLILIKKKKKEKKKKKHTEVLALSKQWLSWIFLYTLGLCILETVTTQREPQWCFVYLAGETGVTVPLRSMWVNTVNTVWGQIVPNNPPSARLNTNGDPNNNVVGYPLAGNPPFSIDFVQKYK